MPVHKDTWPKKIILTLRNRHTSFYTDDRKMGGLINL
jgi:hypothetical protein